MIRYALKCKDGHSFESWFQSAEAYDKLAAAGMVSCAICGSDKVEKAIMAPRVRPGRNAVSKVGEAEAPASAPTPAEPPAPAAGALSSPSGDLEKAVKELRSHIEKTSDYVGKDFVSEARKMHLGDSPERAIHGEAKPEEAKALIEEGVPVVPLPFLPNRKTN
ncbi:hypothetical protein NIT7321_01354 [Phaeobacter italicus]|uniref:DUF1178 family protein n=1 Tax=Phaeobacter italicus TaxID=481446 RepID=A0A0H5D0D4_9RHOB|nr:DUF1178 family protein [Phaeobacter italicus]CRL10509.1 hypothetical protein NIT7321_01354 [Phaeobacter italicus]